MKLSKAAKAGLDIGLAGVMVWGMTVLAGCGSSGSGGGGGTGGGGGGGGTGGTGGTVGTGGPIYVMEESESGAGTILEFLAGSEGSVAPKATLNLPTNFAAVAVATDSSGQIYVGGNAETDVMEILVYPAGSSGAATPTRTIMTGADSDDTAIYPASMTIDGAGNLYVACGTGGVGVAVYSPTANGAVAPTQLITSSLVSRSNGANDVAVDAAGNMYVTASVSTPVESAAIYVFAPGSTGDATPSRTITTPNGFGGIAVDSSGNIYANQLTVVDASDVLTGITAQIVEFSATAKGAATPTKSITIPNGSAAVVATGGLRIDSADNLFTVAQEQTILFAPIATNVLEYGPTASGSATPASNFSSTSFVMPEPSLQLAIH